MTPTLIALYNLSQGKEKSTKDISEKHGNVHLYAEYNRMKKGERTRISVQLELTVRVWCKPGTLRIERVGRHLGWMASCTERGGQVAAGGE